MLKEQEQEAMFIRTVLTGNNEIEVNETEFIDYVDSFYGKKGLYPIEGLTNSLIKNAIVERKKIKEIAFHGDSQDRELVRDILLDKFNLKQ